MTITEILSCPDCGGECNTIEAENQNVDALVICRNRCGHIVQASTRELAIKKHNAIPRWKSYTDPPKDSALKWVAYAEGFGLAQFNEETGWWHLPNGQKIRILKWTETPIDLPCRH